MLSLSRTLSVVTLASIAMGSIAAGQNTPASPVSRTIPAPRDRVLPPIPYTEFTLPNGLRVILHEDHSTPIVAVNLWYHVGSKNEVPGRTGFAHLFEHMMFQGSKGYDDDYFKALQEIGGTLNGSTNADRTNYWEVVPSNFLERAIFLEADRMGGLLEAMTEEKLANQREVVKNEKRQNYDNRPYGLAGARIAEILYPKDHPYHWLTIGSLEDLTAASMDDVKDFFRRFYTPNNASLSIAGDFKPAEARRLVEKYFGAIKGGPPVNPVRATQPRLSGTVRRGMEDRVASPRVTMVWHSVPQLSADDAALDVLASILGQGKTSRLFKAMVYDRQIAQDVAAFNNAREIAGTLQITATPRRGVPLDTIEAAINREIARMISTPPTREELDRVYNQTEASFIYRLQTVGGFGGKSDQLNQYAIFTGTPGFFEQDLAQYRAVTAADVQRVARQYLTDNRLIFTVTPRARQRAAQAPAPASPAQAGAALPSSSQPMTPQTGVTPGATQPSGAQAVNRAAAAATTPAGAAPPTTTAARTTPNRDLNATLPQGGPEPSFTLPAVQRRKLSNGLDVLIVEHHELPVVTFNLVIKGGAAADPAERPGLAVVTADLIDEGTTSRSSLDISNQLASIGASLGSGADWDGGNLTLTTLTRHMDRALAVFADVLVNPAFATNELNRIRAQRLQALVQRRDDANAIAGHVYASLLFGSTHPYGHPLVGTEASLRAMSVDDLRHFYSSYYRPNNAALIVVGDIRPDQVTARLERALAAWKPGRVPTVRLDARAVERPRSTIYLVDRPGAAQSVINIGHVGAARSTPDYFPLLVLNQMLGGGFVSRVNLNLREDKGYSYGARTAFDYRRAAGPFTASAGVQTAVTKESVVEFLKELRGIRGDIPITQRELEAAKGSLTRGFPRTFETPAQIANRLVDVLLYGLPDNYFNSYIANLQRVTAADVAQVAQKAIDPARMAILVVGDRSVVEQGLRSIEGIGTTLKVVDAEGRPVSGNN